MLYYVVLTQLTVIYQKNKIYTETGAISPTINLLAYRFGRNVFSRRDVTEELVTLVYKTALGMTRLMSTQHHALGGEGPIYLSRFFWEKPPVRT